MILEKAVRNIGRKRAIKESYLPDVNRWSLLRKSYLFVSSSFCSLFSLYYRAGMSKFGAKRGKKLPGAEFTWDDDPGGEPDTAPTPLFPVRPLCVNFLRLAHDHIANGFLLFLS